MQWALFQDEKLNKPVVRSLGELFPGEVSRPLPHLLLEEGGRGPALPRREVGQEKVGEGGRGYLGNQAPVQPQRRDP